MKIVCDTNILISAYRFAKGKPDQVLEKVRQGEIQLVVSPAILLEFQNVLRRKFDCSDSLIRVLTENLEKISQRVTPSLRLSIIKEDEPDNRILECAVEGACDYIISGDEHHILPLREYKGIRILRASEFLNLKPWKKK
jgi:putative PIN family toxin of toxin-antitoxin system